MVKGPLPAHSRRLTRAVIADRGGGRRKRGKAAYEMSARTAEARRMADTSAGLKARYFK